MSWFYFSQIYDVLTVCKIMMTLKDVSLVWAKEIFKTILAIEHFYNILNLLHSLPTIKR